MKRLFPTIRFVEDLPLSVYENDIISHKTTNYVQTGHIRWRTNTPRPFDIIVLKGEKQYKILLHELTHWIIYLIFKLKCNFLHGLLDKYFTVTRKHTEREHRQTAEKVRIWKERIQTNSFLIG